MSDQNNNPENQSDTNIFTGAAQTAEQIAADAVANAPPPEPEKEPEAGSNEKELLMARAQLLGVTFSNNIGVDTLRERIRAKQEALDAADQAAAAAAVPVVGNPLAVDEPVTSPTMTLREQLIAEQMRLVRVRITCMDPKKKDLHGEIFTVANEYIGTVRKFIPFGDFTENGYHIPYCLYTMLEERKFLNIRTVRDRRTGVEEVKTEYAREFALEILPPLTQVELDRLAAAQAAAGSVDVGLV